LGIAVPTSTVHVKTVNVDTILWGLLHFRWIFLWHDLEREGKLVNSDLVVSCMSLQATGHETLREEEVWHTERGWYTIYQPIIHKFNSQDEILIPRSEGFQGWISDLLPVLWYFSISKAAVHSVELRTHDYETIDGFFKKD
jgi:hypothetical protein